MKLVILQFPTVKKLWEFRQYIKTGIFEFSTATRTLCCYCNETQILIAIEGYGAAIIEEDISPPGK